jgi:glycerol kinase
VLRPIRVDGGMSRNDSLLQAIADLTGVVLEHRATAEVTALGAGSLAGLGAGLWDLSALEGMPFETGYQVRPALDDDARAAVRQAWQTVLARSLAGVSA